MQELFDRLLDKPNSAATSDPASAPGATKQNSEEERSSAEAVSRYGWFALRMLMLGLALNCAQATVGVQGDLSIQAAC